MSVRDELLKGREQPSLDLLGVDLDGTLLNSEWKLTERNHQALLRAHDAGIHLAIVTGRRYWAARQLTAGIRFPHYLVTNAGAQIATSQDEVWLSRPMEGGRLGELLEHLGPFTRHAFLITNAKGKGEIICSDPNMDDPHVARYVSRNDQFLSKSDRLYGEGSPPVLQVACSGRIEAMKALRERADAFRGRGEFEMFRTAYADRDFELVDIVAKGADKGSGLATLATMLKIDPSRVMAIGDNYADSAMLEVAQFPVVMGNAPEEMRRQWPVTGTNDENGVAQAIEHIILSL